MPSVIPGFEYDLFISYRHNDNRSGWVTDFVKALQEELAATIKEPLSIYFDENPHDGLHEHHDVDDSLKDKLKCLIFIPILSRTYCDPKSFAFEHEFKPFVKMATQDQFGLKVKLASGNTAGRVLPMRIHDLDKEDVSAFESVTGTVLRSIDFVFQSTGVNRPLLTSDKKEDNNNHTLYRDQVNKAANAIREILYSLMGNESHIGKNEIIAGFKKEEPGKLEIESKSLTKEIDAGTVNNKKSVTWPLVMGLIVISSLLTGIAVNFFLTGKAGFGHNDNKTVTQTTLEFPADAPLALIGSSPLNVGRPALAISPNAAHLVYVAQADSLTTKLYLHPMDGSAFTPIEGTEGAFYPFFSPDGQWIGFFSGKKLKKVSVKGGKPIDVCDATNPYGAVWCKDERIIFANNEGYRLMWVPAKGGNPEEVFKNEKKPKVSVFSTIFLMPDQEHLLCTISFSTLAILSIKTGELKNLSVYGTMPIFYNGYLIYAEYGRLMAIKFNESTLEVIGSPFPIVESVRTETMVKFAQMCYAGNGTFIYVSGTAADYTSFFWADRKGNIQSANIKPDYYGMFTLSPEGQKIAFCKTSLPSKIGIIDIQQNASVEISSDRSDSSPVWSPDGKWISYFSNSNISNQLRRVYISNLGRSEVLLDSKDVSLVPYSCFHDAKTISCTNNSKGYEDIVNVLLDDTIRLQPLGGITGYGASISPDDRYFAYTNDESGRYEIYVQPYPPTGERWQISTEGGFDAVWSPAGDEIFFRTADKIFVSNVNTKGEFNFKKPEVVFTGQFQDVPFRSFDVTADGQKILMLSPMRKEKTASKAIVVTNWQEQIRKVSPTKN